MEAMMTTIDKPRRRATAWAVVGLVLGSLLIGLEVKQGAPIARAAGGVAIMVMVIGAIWVFQTRSETASALAGKPVDERWELINERSLAVAASVGLLIAAGGFAVMEALGRDNWQFAFMALVLSGGYLVAVAWFRWRL
jgi:hypothetical protein